MPVSAPVNLRLARASATTRLLQQSDLVYQGAFRVPSGTNETNSYSYGGRRIAVTPQGTMIAVGHDWYQKIGEFSIPAPVIASAVGALNRAAVIQPLNDLLAGHRDDVSSGGSSTAIGGLLATASGVIVSDYLTYDANNTQRKSHWKCGWNFAAPAPAGPFQVGPTGECGYVAGYMSWIPTEWRSALGAPALTGLSNVSILSRTSNGPCLNTFDPDAIAVVDPVPTVRLVSYPQAHQTLGAYGVSRTLVTTAAVRGVVFPSGWASVLCVGSRGTGTFGYGEGTADQALDGTLTADGVTKYCYDPAYAGVKGEHAYPYEYFVWAYNVADLLAAKAGQIANWAVVPYATWAFTLPFAHVTREISGAAYDVATNRIFISAAFGDGAAPLVHVFQLT